MPTVRERRRIVPLRKTDRPATPPIFDLFSIEMLHARTGYSETTLYDLKLRPERIRPGFRRKMSGMLRMSERELFGTASEEDNMSEHKQPKQQEESTP